MYEKSDYLQLQHDNISTVTCTKYRHCDEDGCWDPYETYCSSVNVWLVNLQSSDQDVCNRKHLKDALETLEYLIDHDYKMGTIISGYVHRSYKDSCEFNLDEANSHLIYVIVFGTIFMFFICWLCWLDCFCTEFVNRHTIIHIKSNQDDVELVRRV
jgi:hypothetical protein